MWPCFTASYTPRWPRSLSRSSEISSDHQSLLAPSSRHGCPFTMPEPNVFPYYIRTPRPAPEAVPPGRHDFYTWLAQKLLPRRQIRVEKPKYIYVTSEQMKSQPSAIWNLLDDPPSIQGRPSLAIVDLSTNPYHLMRNIFLQHVSSLSSRWVQGSPSRKVAILLPLLPPHSSLFWHPITSSKMNLERSNQLVVLGNDGTCRPNELEGDILLEYSRRQTLLATINKDAG